jgi:4-hydroxysphinganine ceramide fatty acyl 2-hydroxylase
LHAKYLKEFVTFPDVIIMFCLFLISAVVTLFHEGLWQSWLSVVIGVCVYTISEYLTHRFVFHMKPPKHPLLLRFMKRIHYDHHVDPNNLHLLFLPIWYSLPNIIVASIVFYFISGQLDYTLSFAAGVSGFLLFYEWKHYLAHRPMVPKTPWGRAMKKTHLWHHFKNENFWYGVTNPAMDLLLGTYKNEKDVPRSQTAKDLERRYQDQNIGL